jgi:hypothetical protein
MIGNRVIISIQPEGEDVTDPLMQEIIVRVVLKEEQQGVVQVDIRKRLMDLLVMQAEYFC